MKGDEMELLVALTIFIGLVALGSLAAFVGADSRDSIGDDWARPTQA
ncbi:MAG: hypothetical protein ACJ767_12975 [Chloroflexota bacterium]